MKHSAMLVVILCTGAVSAQAQTCTPFGGLVKLTPDLTCKVTQYISGAIFLGAPGTCFTVALKGTISGSGYAGLTSETMINPIVPGVAQSPAILNEPGLTPAPNEFGLPETRRVFTSRSVISLPGGRVFTADAGVIGKNAAAEQLMVSSGDGIYQNASGIASSFNNVIGQWSPITGKLCLGN